MKMLKKLKNESLADKIGDILSAAPSTFDPEDDFNEDTTAKVTENLEDSEDDDELLSSFRTKNVELLEESDVKYKGKKASRKDLENEEDSLEESNVDMNDEALSENDDSSAEEDNSDNEDYSSDDSVEDEETVEENDKSFSHLDMKKTSKELDKGVSVRNQLKIWENLLEIRIQLQKCLMASNKMPQVDNYKEIKEMCGTDFTKKTNETVKTLSNALNKMLDLQNILIKKYPETKNLMSKSEKPQEKDNDEEIPSDTEEEGEKEDETPLPKRRKHNNYETELKEFHQKYTPYRNGVIQKWNEKTRIAIAKNNAPSHSILKQIEYNLNDKSRLIKRTQLKRMQYEIIGEKKLEADQDLSKMPEEYNKEIYDDNDFYHQLLRELIEVKSADLTDPIQLGKQWIKLQNLRSKMKRKVDTRATKGRKVRYTVHNKLINYMAPIDDNLWTDDAKQELFSSLFGKCNKRLFIKTKI